MSFLTSSKDLGLNFIVLYIVQNKHLFQGQPLEARIKADAASFGGL
jgi:hypothetical protein